MITLRNLGTGIIALCLFCTGSFLAGYKLHGGPGVFPHLRSLAEFEAVAPHLESLGSEIESLLQPDLTRSAPGSLPLDQHVRLRDGLTTLATASHTGTLVTTDDEADVPCMAAPAPYPHGGEH